MNNNKGNKMSNHSQWSLLKEKRFLPLFLTQFLGAFNDNVFKNALVILLAFKASILPSGLSDVLAVNISAGLFILPYFLFSAIAGQMADFREKSALIFKLKIIEVILMTLGSFALFGENVYLMWGVLFGLGVQSTFFGPIKYSILPQQLAEKELIGGNALIESGTFLAILLGTILGGILIVKDAGNIYISAIILLISVIGCISSYFIPKVEPLFLGQKVSFNIFKQSVEVIKIANQKSSVFKSILAISWFWFFGATLLSQFPILVKEVIGSSASLVTIFLTVFSIGIVIGSLLCEKLSFSKVEIGLVPFGSLGMIVFLLDFCFNLQSFEKLNSSELSVFLDADKSYRILIDLFLLSVFGGFFTVPLYAFIQEEAAPENRSRIIGANNILNAIFMVVAAVFAVLVVKFTGNIINIFWGLLVLHTLVSLYVFSVVPLFLIRFITWIITHTIYSIKKEGLDNIPNTGATLIIANHVTTIDGLLIFSAIPRPIKFGMDNEVFYKNAKMYESMGAYPLNNIIETNKSHLTKEIIQEHLNAGEVVVYFPEVKITENGELGNFGKDLEYLIEKNNCPILIAKTKGLWGSVFSNKHNGLKKYFNNLLRGKINLSIEKIENKTKTEIIQKLS
jgi:hypothetical protein